MPLVEITQDLVQTYFAEDIGSLIELSDVPSMILNSCNKTAGYVNSNPNNEHLCLDLCQVPSELVEATCVLVRYAILSRLPNGGESFEGSIRRSQYDEAIGLLKRVAKGEFRLAPYGADDDNLFIQGGSIESNWSVI